VVEVDTSSRMTAPTGPSWTRIREATDASLSAEGVRGDSLAVIRSPERSDGSADDRTSNPSDAYLVVHVEFESADACSHLSIPEIPVLARHDRFADLWFPISGGKDLERRLRQAEGFVWLEAAGRVRVPPPDIPPALDVRPRGLPDEIVRGGLEGLTGKGVVLAVIDSGVDVWHEDFVDEIDGKPTSRFLYVWDTFRSVRDVGTGRPGPVAYPNGVPIGTLLDRETITADLRSESPKLREQLDTEGHGTACAGIAAGSGRASRGAYEGVAPGVDLVAIRVGKGRALANAYLLSAAVDWLLRVAGDRPLVVSCSFGQQSGGRDGASVEERAIAARFAADARGRAICIAAGNEGEYPIHTRVEATPKDRPSRPFSVRRTDEWEGPWVVEIWIDAPPKESLRLLTPGGDLEVLAAQATYYPIQKQKCVELLVQGREGTLALATDAATPRSGDAYVRNGPDTAWFPEGDNTFCVGQPGTSESAITVGSYDWNDGFEFPGGPKVVPVIHRDTREVMKIGTLSTYSSAGYVRMSGRVKPDIVGPGQYFTAPLASGTRANPDATGKYRLFNGTSAATPYVAGLVALLLERHPELTCSQVQEALHESASKDRFTGDTPNFYWGYGKLDVAAARRLLRAR
jgi:subtilisin family serine protease